MHLLEYLSIYITTQIYNNDNQTYPSSPRGQLISYKSVKFPNLWLKFETFVTINAQRNSKVESLNTP